MPKWVQNISSCTQHTEWEKIYLSLHSETKRIRPNRANKKEELTKKTEYEKDLSAKNVPPRKGALFLL